MIGQAAAVPPAVESDGVLLAASERSGVSNYFTGVPLGHFGQGKILRSAAEFYAIGVRGHPPERSHSVRNLIVAPGCGHSRKPDQLHRDIEQLYNGPYLELFARRRVPGWTPWGDQLEAEPASLNAIRPDLRSNRAAPGQPL